ncbi:hypothetical protein AVDCRST_MAG81-558 [uncultured Synechococcales cyanobacterium]|uniref:Uncharacterized protein n=1 Tax=uncultured Synechococcales cyanobacterium TaxID=1936017 RepID=A0A6J4UVV8_9CYAN|nr:hypothetical protein AVDCRST_MAG81-558 [uncultured Synechococcales cyanobacterium]
MFDLEDYVVNQTTQQIGKVIGHGHSMINNNYEPTLKVLVDQGEGSDQPELVVEDLSSVWSQYQNSDPTAGAAGQ